MQGGIDLKRQELGDWNKAVILQLRNEMTGKEIARRFVRREVIL